MLRPLTACPKRDWRKAVLDKTVHRSHLECRPRLATNVPVKMWQRELTFFRGNALLVRPSTRDGRPPGIFQATGVAGPQIHCDLGIVPDPVRQVKLFKELVGFPSCHELVSAWRRRCGRIRVTFSPFPHIFTEALEHYWGMVVDRVEKIAPEITLKRITIRRIIEIW